MTYSASGGQKGFTLVELLLSITLMAMLLGLAYGGLRAATRASAKGQVILEETGRLRITHQFVRRQLNQMLPLTFLGPDDYEDAPTTRFIGSDMAVQFVAPMPGYLGSGGPHVQRLEFVNGENGLDLLFTHALWQGFVPEALSDREPVVLLRDLEYGGFQFAGEEDGEITEWMVEWEAAELLPLAVRLEIDFAEGTSTRWPVLAASVRLDPAAMQQSATQKPYDETITDMINRRRDRDN